MANINRQSFGKLLDNYGKRVEANVEKVLAKGSVEISKVADNYKSYNGDGYSTLFVDFDGERFAIDSKIELPDVIQTVELAVVSGVYQNKEYTKIRITAVS